MDENKLTKEREILQRQVDEYKSAVLNQSHLISTLQALLEKQKKGGEHTANYSSINNDTIQAYEIRPFQMLGGINSTIARGETIDNEERNKKELQIIIDPHSTQNLN